MVVTNLLFFPSGGRGHKTIASRPGWIYNKEEYAVRWHGAAKGSGMARKKPKTCRRRAAGLLAAVSLGMLLPSGCSADAQPLSRTGFALDTVVTVSLYDRRDASLLDACFAQIAHCEALFSRTKEGSDVWNLNHAGGAWTPVAQETAALLRTAKSLAALTQGAFDPTIAPASALWDFTAESPALPDPGLLAEAASHVDYTCLEVEDGRARLTDPQAAVDLGGIAKGYIADRLAALLRENGVESALIDLGGNIFALGQKSGKDWRIGIRDPADSGGTAAVAAAADQAVVTSGIYERGFDLGGVRYHHLLNPADGMPVHNGLAAVTVICADSAQADALSTACFVLGEQEGTALIESLGETQALFIRRDGTMTATAGFPWDGA